MCVVKYPQYQNILEQKFQISMRPEFYIKYYYVCYIKLFDLLHILIVIKLK